MTEEEPMFDEEVLIQGPHVKPLVRPGIEVNYWRGGAPGEYCCSRCGAGNCKLWQNASGNLLCATHAAEEEDADITDLEARIRSFELIGALYPAVPKPDNRKVMWDQHNIPAQGMCWWRNLSTLPV